MVLFVVCGKTRAVASLVEAAGYCTPRAMRRAYCLSLDTLSTSFIESDEPTVRGEIEYRFCSLRPHLVLALEDIKEGTICQGEAIQRREAQDLNRGRKYLRGLADSCDFEVYNDPESACLQICAMIAAAEDGSLTQLM